MTQRPKGSSEKQQRDIRRLADLSLTVQEYRALRCQGTVCSEHRRGNVYFRLRFRRADGRQCVRYLGSDPAVAETIRREVHDLQRHRRHMANLQRRDKEVRKLLRQVKQNLANAIEVFGFHWHGFEIRRRVHREQTEEPNDQAG